MTQTANYRDRVRRWLRARQDDEYARSDGVIDRYGATRAIALTVADVEALLQDADRLAEVEDL